MVTFLLVKISFSHDFGGHRYNSMKRYSCIYRLQCTNYSTYTFWTQSL